MPQWSRLQAFTKQVLLQIIGMMDGTRSESLSRRLKAKVASILYFVRSPHLQVPQLFHPPRQFINRRLRNL